MVGGAIAGGPADTAVAVPPTGGGNEPTRARINDNLRTPRQIKQDAQRQVALQQRLEGKPSAQRKVAKLADEQYVQLDREGTGNIFVVLVEFGDQRFPNPTFADDAPVADPQPQQFTGPLHNQIPQPNRRVDNSTLWERDYNKAHFEDMYFNRMAKYYETQSSGRYSVDGDVTEWVKVPFNQALYGRNYCSTPQSPSVVCDTTKALVRDGLAVWVDQQLKSGQTMAQIRTYLATFDKEDRYDIDGDGNFNEPDGFIDHFQLVHAGGDEASGDPIYGSDAIWSHRWYANLQAGGPGGQAGVNVGSNGGLVSSTQVPNNPTGVWVGDYTVQPENGGLGVFAHEFAHDLGLPDLYDTSGNTGGAENSTAFWSLMSSGANIGDGRRFGIGDAPTDFSAWELYQLGWLNAQGGKGPFYEVANAGEESTHKLATNVPASTTGAQALFTLLPDKVVPQDLGEPAEGEWMYYSTAGNDLDSTMTRTEGISGGAFSAQVRFDIETDWDYAYVETSPDGETWTPVETNLSTDTNPNSQNDGNGITGSSDGEWVELNAELPPGTEAVRIRYWTDVAEVLPGLLVDQITLDGTPIGTAETGAEGWTFAGGFLRVQQEWEQTFFNAYVSENRQYDGYDRSLRTAYNFGYLNTRPEWVETHPYEAGLLVWYWDTSEADNNVGDHPGSGLLLPVDAHPQFSYWPDGTLMRPRILSYDSTFGLKRTTAITVHQNGVGVTIPSKPAVKTFDDTKSYWSNTARGGATGSHPGRYQPGWYGVNVPKTGTTITVDSLRNGVMTVSVGTSA